jgi:hypothetical protein
MPSFYSLLLISKPDAACVKSTGWGKASERSHRFHAFDEWPRVPRGEWQWRLVHFSSVNVLSVKRNAPLAVL